MLLTAKAFGTLHIYVYIFGIMFRRPNFFSQKWKCNFNYSISFWIKMKPALTINVELEVHCLYYYFYYQLSITTVLTLAVTCLDCVLWRLCSYSFIKKATAEWSLGTGYTVDSVLLYCSASVDASLLLSLAGVKQAVRLGRRHNMPPPHLDFWPWSRCGSRMWPVLPLCSFIFLGLLVFELEPMYATSDRRTDDRCRWPPNAPASPTGAGA